MIICGRLVSYNYNYPEILSIILKVIFELESWERICQQKRTKGQRARFPVRLFVLYKGAQALLWPQVLAWLGSKVWIIGQSDGQECISYFTTADWIFISFVPPRPGLAGSHSFITQTGNHFSSYKSIQSSSVPSEESERFQPSLSVSLRYSV